MVFLYIFLSLLLEVLLHYIVLLYSILPSTCLLSSFVLEFLFPFPQFFGFLGVKVVENTVQRSSPHQCGQENYCNAFNAVVAAFPLDISAFLSFPCSSEIYLHCWNFLEGYIGQGEVDLTDICQVRGVRPSRTSAFQHCFALPPTMEPFPMLSPPRTRYC